MTKEDKLEKFGPGPWIDEPDHVTFEHEGLACIVHRTEPGHLCGYVAVGPRHPLHGKSYGDQVPKGLLPEPTVGDFGASLPFIPMFIEALGTSDSEADSTRLDVAIGVHGGITYAERNGDAIGNIDTPEAWWFGFDCSHSGDWSPRDFSFFLYSNPEWSRPRSGEVYRDINYVTAQVKHLAEQLKAAHE